MSRYQYNRGEAKSDAVTTKISSKSSKRYLSDLDASSDTKKLKLHQTVAGEVPKAVVSKEKNNEIEKEKTAAPESSKKLELHKIVTIEVSKDVVIQEKNKENEKEKTADCDVITPSAEIIALNCVSEYMQKKSLTKLSRNDLEQICLMKMCEAIRHKSEIGQLRHQLGVQEQMIELWGEEVAQLAKQARDLEIVNKRLLHEVRLKNKIDKPLIPLKITRSVGIQVQPDNSMIGNVIIRKKRTNIRLQPTNTIAPTKQQKYIKNRANINKSTIPNTSNRVTTKSTKVTTTPTNQPPTKGKVLASKSPSSLSQKVLKNSAAQAATTNAATNTASVSTPSHVPTTEQKILVPTDNSVTPNTPTIPTPISATVTNKNITNASPTTPAKPDKDDKNPTIGTATSTTLTPQLHQGVLAPDPTKPRAQKLMLKQNSNVIGSQNGVLTAVQSGSAISVDNTPLRTGQVQPVRLSPSSPVTAVKNTTTAAKAVLKHPAPSPPPPASQLCLPARKPIPPKPHLSLRRSSGGIVLSWKMPYNLDNFESIASYQLYAKQEITSSSSSDIWRKVGEVKALALPMACTLAQFVNGNKYHFAVRAVDVLKRMGPFSDSKQILL